MWLLKISLQFCLDRQFIIYLYYFYSTEGSHHEIKHHWPQTHIASRCWPNADQKPSRSLRKGSEMRHRGCPCSWGTSQPSPSLTVFLNLACKQNLVSRAWRKRMSFEKEKTTVTCGCGSLAVEELNPASTSEGLESTKVCKWQPAPQKCWVCPEAAKFLPLSPCSWHLHPHQLAGCLPSPA